MNEKISPRAGLELGTANSVGQRLTHCATVAPKHSGSNTDGSYTLLLRTRS